jgi:hypothetical protein
MRAGLRVVYLQLSQQGLQDSLQLLTPGFVLATHGPFSSCCARLLWVLFLHGGDVKGIATSTVLHLLLLLQ